MLKVGLLYFWKLVTIKVSNFNSMDNQNNQIENNLSSGEDNKSVGSSASKPTGLTKMKNLLKPTKWKIFIFILLFVIIYLIPYYKVEIDPNTVSMIKSGRYPLIYGLGVVFFDIFSGIFEWGAVFVFISFIASFFIVYAVSCLIVYFTQRLFAKNKG